MEISKITNCDLRARSRKVSEIPSLCANQKKGSRFPATPWIDMVAGPGFEPGTFGLADLRNLHLKALPQRRGHLLKGGELDVLGVVLDPGDR